MNKQLVAKVSSAIGGLLAGAISILEVFSILSNMGFTIFGEIHLTDPQKILFFSLLIFFGLFSAILELTSIYFMRKGHTKASAISSYAGVISALLGLITPNMFGFAQSGIFLIGMTLSMIFMGTSAILASTIPSKAMGPLLTSVEVAVVALFSALYAVLIILTFQIYPVPSPTGGLLHFGDFVVFLVALLFGVKVGGLVGVVGAVVADFYLGYPRWYVSIIAHGLEGAIPGLTKKRSFVLQLIACIVGGFLMAATYFFVNIFIKGYPVAVISFVQDLFLQAGISIALGLPIVKVVERTLPWFR
ncbi:MAG: ECF transporter S component [Candidatus Bathyarchaeia archaeon]